MPAVPRTITFQEPNRTSPGDNHVNLTEQGSESDEAEMNSTTEETPFLVACFTTHDDEVMRALGLDDDSDDGSDWDDRYGGDVY